MLYRFGPFAFDEARFELRRGDETVPLQPKPMELLIHLLRRHPSTCTREELFEALWDDASVTSSSLTTTVRALRQALGEEAAGSVIRTVRGRGYGISIDVETDGGPTPVATAAPKPAAAVTPPADVASTSDGFIGRTQELDQGRRALTSALAGRTQLLLVAGEPGIGKTRLVEELCVQATAAGARVVWGQSHEGGAQPAFWPWIRVLAELTTTADDQALLRDQLRTHAAELTGLLPQLTESLGAPTSAPGSSTPEAARFRLFESVSLLIAKQASVQPLVIALDDLQWADESSLELLAFVANELPTCPLLIAATYRDIELFPNAELTRALATLARGKHPTFTQKLDGLDRDDFAQLVDEASQDGKSSEWVEIAFERTRGNPFFAREILQLDASEDAVAGSIPPGIQHVLLRRLAALDDDCLDLLSTASALGRDFRLTLLASAEGRKPVDVLAALEPAEHARLIEATPGTSGTYRFSHPLIQETLYAELSLRDRIARHTRVADAFDALHGDNPGVFLSQIAHHLVEALPAIDPAGALEASLRAADYETRILAFESAVHTLERCVRVLDESGALEARRCDVFTRLAEARVRAGQRDASAEEWQRVLTYARGAEDARAFARGAIGLSLVGAFTAHRSDEILDVLREALQRLPEDELALRARVLSSLAWQLTWTPDWRQQDEISLRAAELARQADDRPTLIAVLAQRAGLLELHGTDDARRRTYEEIDALAVASDDREGLARARTLRLQHTIESADAKAIDGELDALERLATELRLPIHRLFCARVRVLRTLWRGDLGACEERLQESLELGRKCDSEHAALVWSAQLGSLRKVQGRMPELEAALRAAAERHPMMVSFRCALAGLLAEAGRDEEARELFDALAHHDFAALRPGDPHYWMNLALLSELCRALDDRGRAAWLYDALRPREHRYLAVPHVVTAGCGARYMGALASVLGNREQALSHLDDAITTERAMAARTWLAAALAERARVLLERDEEGDRNAARLAIAEASGIADDCGLGGLRRTLEAVTAALR